MASDSDFFSDLLPPNIMPNKEPNDEVLAMAPSSAFSDPGDSSYHGKPTLKTLGPTPMVLMKF